MGSKLNDLSIDGTIDYLSNSIEKKDNTLIKKTISAESGKIIRFTGNFGMGNYGSVPDVQGNEAGKLKISDGTSDVTFVALDFGSESNENNLALEVTAAATKSNLHLKTLTLTDSSDNEVTFTFNNTTSTTTGTTIGLQNANNVDTIADRIYDTINANSFNIQPVNISYSAADDEAHHIKLRQTNTGTTYTTNANSDHLKIFLTILAGQDNAANSVVAEMVTKINARTQLNVTASAVAGGNSEDASIKILAGDGATVTVTEDPDNQNSGNYGGSSGFTVVSNVTPTENIVHLSATLFRYASSGIFNIRGQTTDSSYKTFIGIETD
ncbi:MAG: hypothetical protein CMF52_07065 [Legionellales bacterium]|nr:hypothetical protein [Legionellales bacterium]|tara:strand:+ start:5166 stop:6140 length:975 start_codon:yes stop_codon:yes gene_type:complete